ncbi:MAG: NAD(P)/FAD-dependent oxidoreductase [Halanaeroarchaeum sp.]
MRQFDLIVLGGGTGNIVASAAADEGERVALVERGPLGGTCLNRGCNPSKKLVHRANVAQTVRNAGVHGVDATLNDLDGESIIETVTETVTVAAEQKAQRARAHERVTLYQTTGAFRDEHVVGLADARDDRIRAERIVLAGGSRPLVPDGISGTDDVSFLTSDEGLSLSTVPDRLVVVGGGYIAVELGHVLNQFGSDVTIVHSGDRLVHHEDRDVAERLTEAYRNTHDLHLGSRARALAEDGDEVIVRTDGDGRDLRGDEVLLAVGRRPNTDLWDVDAAGLATDDRGFVVTDDHLETSVDGVYAIGDIAGNHMFKHSGDVEARYVLENAVRGGDEPVEYPGMAHAVFGSPQLASLGLPEREVPEDTSYEVGVREYDDTALGAAMVDYGGFAKAVVADDGDVLGFHVVGPEASTLVHEVSTAVAAGADAETVARTIHVHPALSEVVQGAFRDVVDVAPTGF